jgi:nitrogen fixation NifU-like protein
MTQNSLEFWENHSVSFLNMVFKTEKRESLTNPDGYGKYSRECGDTIEIFLLIRDEVIYSASFETDGCLYSLACANAVVHLAEGRSIDEARESGAQDVVEYLETLPRAERHCAELAARALHLALANAHEMMRHPWKKFYRSAQ